MLVGRYTVLRTLGEGGMAKVVLAKSASDQLVVLKVPLFQNPDHYERLRDEARVGLRLNHPSVVETLDLFEHDGKPILVVEYVDGASLAQIREVGPLPPTAVVRVGRQIAEALDAIHNATDEFNRPLNMMHRDVTPGNILINRDGDAKLIDLGISRSAETIVRNTNAGAVRGTLRYLAPELIEGKKHSAACDLWSLGVVLWEAVLGRTALKGDDKTILKSILDGKLMTYLPGEALAPQMHDTLAALLARPESRLQKAMAAANIFSRLEESFGAGEDAAIKSVERAIALFPRNSQKSQFGTQTSVLLENMATPPAPKPTSPVIDTGEAYTKNVSGSQELNRDTGTPLSNHAPPTVVMPKAAELSTLVPPASTTEATAASSEPISGRSTAAATPAGTASNIWADVSQVSSQPPVDSSPISTDAPLAPPGSLSSHLKTEDLEEPVKFVKQAVAQAEAQAKREFTPLPHTSGTEDQPISPPSGLRNDSILEPPLPAAQDQAPPSDSAELAQTVVAQAPPFSSQNRFPSIQTSAAEGIFERAKEKVDEREASAQAAVEMAFEADSPTQVKAPDELSTEIALAKMKASMAEQTSQQAKLNAAQTLPLTQASNVPNLASSINQEPEGGQPEFSPTPQFPANSQTKTSAFEQAFASMPSSEAVSSVFTNEGRAVEAGAPATHDRETKNAQTKVLSGNEKAELIKREQERAAQEKAAQEKAAQEKAAQEKAAQEKAAQEKAAQEKAAQEKAAQEKAAQEKAAQEKAAQEKAAQEKAAQEKAAQEKAAQEKALLEDSFVDAKTILKDQSSSQSPVLVDDPNSSQNHSSTHSEGTAVQDMSELSLDDGPTKLIAQTESQFGEDEAPNVDNAPSQPETNIEEPFGPLSAERRAEEFEEGILMVKSSSEKDAAASGQSESSSLHEGVQTSDIHDENQPGANKSGETVKGTDEMAAVFFEEEIRYDDESEDLRKMTEVKIDEAAFRPKKILWAGLALAGLLTVVGLFFFASSSKTKPSVKAPAATEKQKEEPKKDLAPKPADVKSETKTDKAKAVKKPRKKKKKSKRSRKRNRRK